MYSNKLCSLNILPKPRSYYKYYYYNLYLGIHGTYAREEKACELYIKIKRFFDVPMVKSRIIQ